MILIEQTQTTINDEVFGLADFIVTGLIEAALEDLKEIHRDGGHEVEFESVLRGVLAETMMELEEEFIEHELETLEELGYTNEQIEYLSDEDIERIVWNS